MTRAALIAAIALSGCIEDRAPPPHGLNVTLPTSDAGCQPFLVIEPIPVELGAVPILTERTVTVQLANFGCAPVDLWSAAIEGSEAITAAISGQRLDFEPQRIFDPDGDDISGIAAGGLVNVEVSYFPERLGLAEATLLLDSSDPEAPTEIAIHGRTLVCLDSPREVVAAVDLGRSTTHGLEVGNCGDTDIGLEATEVLEPAAGWLIAGRSADWTRPMAPGGRRRLTLHFEPPSAGAHGADLTIRTDATARPLRVRLSGFGVPPSCPRPILVEDSVRAVTGHAVRLDGSHATDRQGRPRAWRWLVREAPDRATAQPTERADAPEGDDRTTPTAWLRPDRPGRWLIELRVTGSEGLTAPSEDCPLPPAILTLQVR